MPDLSIIIPIYNAERYLKECLESIVRHMMPDDELILINDGSNDKSLQICRQYVAGNVYIIDNTNHGVSYSRNCGISAATGRYITFVDADDYLLPDWRDIVAAGMQTDADIVYFTDQKNCSPDRKQLVLNTLCIPDKDAPNLRASACWGKLFSRTYILQKNICFDKEIINGEDSLFCLQAVLSAGRFAIVQAQDFYYYRTNNASATHTFNERYHSSNIRYITCVNQELTAAGLYLQQHVKQIMDYITANGLYILAYRLSLQNDAAEQEKRFVLFSSDEYTEFYRHYKPNPYLKGFKKHIFALISKKKYRTAVNQLNIYRKLMVFAKRVLKR